jgi:hypothetical protein
VLASARTDSGQGLRGHALGGELPWLAALALGRELDLAGRDLALVENLDFLPLETADDVEGDVIALRGAVLDRASPCRAE